MATLTNTILLIEDDLDTRDMLARVLSGEGYAVKVAANGWEGLLAAENPPPDLILLDIMLPGMDGVSFMRSLRNTAALRNVPVIVVTALDVADVEQKMRSYNVAQIISKNDSLFPKLKAALKRTLEQPRPTNRVELPPQGELLRPYLDLYFKMPAWH